MSFDRCRWRDATSGMSTDVSYRTLEGCVRELVIVGLKGHPGGASFFIYLGECPGGRELFVARFAKSHLGNFAFDMAPT